jgi:[ribosomal protein S18]-alanine N-acetyltransferase
MAARAVALRLACTHDAPAMAGMSRELIETGLAWRYSPSRVAALIADPETAALVACDGAQLLGFSVMQFGDERAHLSLLCVQVQQQRRGIATRLLEWLVRSARVAGIGSIDLELRADNEAALRFYRSQGFSETVLVPGYYEGRFAARRMVRVLRPPGALPGDDGRRQRGA